MYVTLCAAGLGCRLNSFMGQRVDPTVKVNRFELDFRAGSYNGDWFNSVFNVDVEILWITLGLKFG